MAVSAQLPVVEKVAASEVGTDCGSEGLESPPPSAPSDEERPFQRAVPWTVPTLIQQQTNFGTFWVPLNIPVMAYMPPAPAAPSAPWPCAPASHTGDNPQRPRANPVRSKQVERTTVMFRNMPNNLSRDMLVKLLRDQGFAGFFDFVYLPIDFKTGVSLGYAFVNLVNADAASRFFKLFEGFSDWPVPSKKVASVSWSSQHQGFHAHVRRYQNSAIMADDVPEEYKPVIFKDDVQLAFPLERRDGRAQRRR